MNNNKKKNLLEYKVLMLYQCKFQIVGYVKDGKKYNFNGNHINLDIQILNQYLYIQNLKIIDLH